MPRPSQIGVVLSFLSMASSALEDKTSSLSPLNHYGCVILTSCGLTAVNKLVWAEWPKASHFCCKFLFCLFNKCFDHTASLLLYFWIMSIVVVDSSKIYPKSVSASAVDSAVKLRCCRCVRSSAQPRTHRQRYREKRHFCAHGFHSLFSFFSRGRLHLQPLSSPVVCFGRKWVCTCASQKLKTTCLVYSFCAIGYWI